MSTITKTRENLVRKIDKLRAELKLLQDKCPHTDVIKEHRSSTGNYDPHADRYWTELHCPECGKGWIRDGSV